MDAAPLDSAPAVPAPSVPATASATPWWQPILQGAKRNLIPGLVLQAFALALVVVYYAVPAARGVYEAIGRLKVDSGFAGSAISTALAAGLIPWLVLYARGQVPRAQWGRDLIFVCLLWGWRGVEVDLFYRLQALLFGTGTDVVTIIIKMFVDQFGYTLVWANPTLAIAYLWRERGYDLAATRAALSWRGFLRDVIVVQASAWMVWIPAVSIIYSLPKDLQFPLFAVVVCFWSLLLATVAAKKK